MPDSQEIRMYFHGPVAPENDSMTYLKEQQPIAGHQRTFLAVSSDGINFTMKNNVVLGSSYFRVWQWQGDWYALGMPGILYRSQDGGLTFEVGKQVFSDDCRHTAVALNGNILKVYYSQVGDCPERIRMSTIQLDDDWQNWEATPPTEVIQPVETWEGVDEPLEPSIRGLATTPVNQLRDPAVFEEEGHRYLLYSYAGEQGIALTQLS